MLALVWCAGAQTREVELVPFVPSNKVDPILELGTSFDRDSSEITYAYKLSNKLSSEQNIKTLTVIHDGSSVSETSPPSWIEFRAGQDSNVFKKPAFSWVPAKVQSLIKPGETVTGFGCVSTSLPGVSSAYVKGDVRNLRANQNYSNPEAVLPPEENNLHIDTVSPMIAVENITASDLAGQLDFHWKEAEFKGWLPVSGVDQPNLYTLLESLRNDNFSDAVSRAEMILESLESQPPSLGRALLQPSLEYIVSRWARPAGPLAIEISVISKHVKPHKNEEAVVEVTTSIRANLDISVFRVAGLPQR